MRIVGELSVVLSSRLELSSDDIAKIFELAARAILRA
jgi:hypothetical protein